MNNKINCPHTKHGTLGHLNLVVLFLFVPVHIGAINDDQISQLKRNIFKASQGISVWHPELHKDALHLKGVDNSDFYFYIFPVRT